MRPNSTAALDQPRQVKLLRPVEMVEPVGVAGEDDELQRAGGVRAEREIG